MKSVTHILASQNTSLRSLLERAAILDGINQRLTKFIPAPLKQHICLANIRDDTAIILADSSTWLTRARYLGPDILGFLRQEPGLQSLKKILFKIHLLTPQQDTVASHPQRNENAAELLLSTAKVIHDPKLKAALHNLSQHCRKE